MTLDLSIVICTLDEADAIGLVLGELDTTLAGLAAEVIVVDDSLDDATALAVRAFTPAHVSLRLIRREGARGLASAAAEGWAASQGRILGLMDGDGQHDPEVLPHLMAHLTDGDADIAVASRYMAGACTGLSGYRHALSASGTALAKGLTGVATTDPMAGLFLFRRTWWNAARDRLNPMGYKILLDLALSGDRAPRIVEVPTALRRRLGGRSKLDARVLADLAAHLIEKSTGGMIPAKFVLFGAVGASGVAVDLGVLAIATHQGAAFWMAQVMAVLAAMTSNFFFNNFLTFRERRLSGLAWWRGLAAFYAACGAGALLNQAIAMGAYDLGLAGPASALVGAVASAAWNYTSASKISWGADPIPMPQPGAPVRTRRFRRRLSSAEIKVWKGTA
jgi:dolichol-phosphate mannosyltransferase